MHLVFKDYEIYYSMKILLIFLYIHLTFCYYKDLIVGYDLISNFGKLFSSLSAEVDEIYNSESGSEKSQRKEDLIDVINKIIKELNDTEKIKKLKELIDKLNGKDHLGNIVGGSVFANNGITKIFSKKNMETINNFQKEFCNEMTCDKIPLGKMKDSFNTIIGNGKMSEYLSNAGRVVGVVGQGILTYNNFKKNYSKCKNKNEDSAGIAFLQTGVNSAINLGFNYAGSILGSCIPIPVLGSILGGIAGNYMGSFINSLIDIDC